MVSDQHVYGVGHIKEVIDFFENNEQGLDRVFVDVREEFSMNVLSHDMDFSEVKGQENMKRALEIAAAGGHNLMLIGPPGAGKTMLARRLPTILPPLSLSEALETTKIHSVAGKLPGHATLVSRRPFPAPQENNSAKARGCRG